MTRASFEVRQRIARVTSHLRAKRWDEAYSEIEQALALFSESAPLLALAADWHLKNKKLSEAEVFLRRAETADPADDLVISAGAELAFERRDFKRAAELYQRVVDRKPSSYHGSRLVQALHRLGRDELAADVARQMLERFQNDVWLLSGLAAAEAGRGRREEAITLYEKVLALRPNDRFAYKELMRLRTAEAPPEESARELKVLMKAGDRSKNAHLRTLAADRLRKAGKDAEAVVEYKAAIEIDPANLYALAQLGFCYRRLGETESAIEFLARAFLADPSNPSVRRTLESLCRKAGAAGRMAELVERALQSHPEVKELYGARKRLTSSPTQTSSSAGRGGGGGGSP